MVPGNNVPAEIGVGANACDGINMQKNLTKKLGIACEFGAKWRRAAD